MNDLRELYQQLILDHNQSPRNFKKLEDFDFHKHGHNPLCGDQLEIFIKLKKDTITNLTFIGSGCAISKASASIMTETLIGKTISEANLVFNKFREMAKSGEVSEELPMKLKLGVDIHLGQLNFLAGYSITKFDTEFSIGGGLKYGRFKIIYATRFGSQEIGEPKIFSIHYRML